MHARALAAAAATALASTLVAFAAAADDADASKPLGPRAASNASASADPVIERHPPGSIRIPLLLGGLGIAGAAYGLGVLASNISPDVPGAGSLEIPVVGPWIALGKNDCAPSNPDCGALKPFRGVMLAFEGIVQIAGLALVGEAIFLKTESKRDDAALLEIKSGAFSVRPDFAPTKSGGSLGLSGTF